MSLSSGNETRVYMLQSEHLMLKHVLVDLICIPSDTKCLKLMFTCTTKLVYNVV